MVVLRGDGLQAAKHLLVFRARRHHPRRLHPRAHLAGLVRAERVDAARPLKHHVSLCVSDAVLLLSRGVPNLILAPLMLLTAKATDGFWVVGLEGSNPLVEMGQLMLLEVEFLDEVHVADFTYKGFFLRMYQLMLLKIPVFGESFVTYGTHKRLLYWSFRLLGLGQIVLSGNHVDACRTAG